MNDQELNRLLREWKAPEAPPSLTRRVLPQRSPWAWLWSGSIRIPVPVVMAAGLAIAAWLYFSRSPAAAPQPVSQGESVSLAEFEPVKELKVRVLTVGGKQQ